MKKIIIILGMLSLILLIGCEKSDRLNRNCKVIEKGSNFDIELSGTYTRTENESCCIVNGLDESYLKKDRTYTMLNMFTYCVTERNRGTITIQT